MSQTSRANHPRIAIADLRAIKSHPTTLGDYKIADEKVAHPQLIRAFGPGSTIKSRDNKKTEYYVSHTGSFLQKL